VAAEVTYDGFGFCRPVEKLTTMHGTCPKCSYRAIGMTAEAVFRAMGEHWQYERHLQSAESVCETGDTK
jgi:hypothetical protein